MNKQHLKSSGVLVSALALSIASMTQSSFAQSMDYGSLQDMFGESVTTSATGKPQRVSEVPTAMTIVSAEEIIRSGARTIPDILNRVVGVDVLNWSVTGADVGVRGYNQGNNPKLLVLVNGRQVYQDFYGVTIWSQIPVQLSEIRQIEVVKGPQSALFGFNAVSGVVNIVTYSPLYDNVGTAEVTIGSQGQKEISLVKTVKLGDRGGVRVSAGGWNVGHYDTAAIGTTARFFRDESLRRTASVDSLFQVTPDVQAGLEATWGRSDEYRLGPSGTPGSSVYDTQSYKGLIKANSSIGLLEGNFYINTLDVFLRNTGAGLITSTNTKVGQLQDLVKLTDSLTTRVGLEFRQNRIDSWPVKGASTGYDNYALSNMYDWQVNPDLSLTVAVRLDRTALQRKGGTPYPFTDADYERKFNSFSYNAGIVWRASPEDTILATAARGIGSPSLAEFSNNALTKPAAGTLQTSGNPYVDPSIATNYELSWRRAIDAIGGFGRLSVSKQKTTDLKFINTSVAKLINGYPTFLIADNLGSTKAWAVEAELAGKIEAYRWNLSWLWMDTNDSIQISNARIGQDYEESNARNTVKANLGWDSGPLSADVFLIWKSKTNRYFNSGSGSRLTEIDPGLTAQASVGYQVNQDLRISLSGANLLRDETQLALPPKAERRVWATVSYKL